MSTSLVKPRQKIVSRSQAEPPTTPIEILSVTFDDASHKIRKQTRASCANGINVWWVETFCGKKVVVTQLAKRNEDVTCDTCVSQVALLEPLIR